MILFESVFPDVSERRPAIRAIRSLIFAFHDFDLFRGEVVELVDELID